MNAGPVFSRQWAMPSADTFSIAPIAAFVARHARGVVVDPFARNSLLGTYRNDLNPNTRAEYHMDAVAFLEKLAADGVIADTVIMDPPYSPRQTTECYAEAGLKAGMRDTQNAALYARVRRAARLLMRPGATALSFGWNSAGMGAGLSLWKFCWWRTAAHTTTRFALPKRWLMSSNWR